MTLREGVPGDTLRARVSLRYCVAAALRFGALGSPQFTDEALRDPLVQKFMALIEIRQADDLPDNGLFPAAVEVRLADGHGDSVRCDIPPGAPAMPMSEAEADAEIPQLRRRRARRAGDRAYACDDTGHRPPRRCRRALRRARGRRAAMIPSRQVTRRPVLARRQILAGAVLLFPAAARAGDWPERTVRMIVPYVAGAGADIVGRTFAEELAKALGQAVVVDNKGGAGGLMGTAEGARAPADGYTLLLTSQGTTVFNIGLYKAPGYDPLKDLAPVAVAGTLPNVLVVSPANPAATVADLVAQARAKPDELTYGSSGVGSSLHLSGVILEQRTGVRLQHVPYRGAPAAVLAVVDGEVTMGFFNTPTVLGQIKGGKLKALAVTSAARSVMLPDVPTMMEAGVPDFVVATWLGFALPAGAPGAIVARLNTEINRISQDPQVKEKLLVQGFEMLPPGSPEAARKLIEDDQALWLPIIKESGAKA